MKQYIAFLLLLEINIIIAQDIKQPTTLRVVGQGEVTVKPNIGVLSIHVFKSNIDFNQAITGLNVKSQEISKQLTGLGFSQDAIKTVNFQVNLDLLHENGRTYDTVFISSQNIELEFNNNKEMITKLINTFSKSKIDFNLQFMFKLSDSLKLVTQKEIIRLAINDASEKAKLIAETSIVKLKRIKDIDYNGYIGMRNTIQGSEYIRGSRTSNEALLGFSPKDLIFNDNVTITWEIE